MVTELKRRSFLKAFSWRITATATTTVISFFIVGDVTVALKIGFLEFFAKMGLYYGHERLWSHIRYGIVERQPNYHI